MNQYFLPIYTTCIGTIIGLLVGWLKSLLKTTKKKKEEENSVIDALKDGMAIILKKQLFEYYAIYEFQDQIPISDWEEIEETHKAYKKLEGNHSGDRVYEAMKSKHLGGKNG